MSRLSTLALSVLAILATVLPAMAADRAAWRALDAANALATDKPKEAIGEIEKLLLDAPDFHAAHYNLGCLLLDGDPAQAAEHLRQAAASPVPDLAASAEHNLALALYRQGRLEAALEAAARASQLRPDDDDLARTRRELERVYLRRLDEARKKAEEEARRLRLGTSELPPAWEGEAYTTRLEAAGGSGGPYTFSCTQVPADLMLTQSGDLRGTPVASTAGSHDLAIVVGDGTSNAEGTIALHILPTPAITTKLLPEALLDMPYGTTVATQGLLNPTWTVTGLPPGLAIAGTGNTVRLSGTPRSVGTWTVTLAAKDPYHEVSASLELQVSADNFAPDCARLPDATVWRPYEHRLTVRGPEATYRWSAEPKNGLDCDAAGHVRGQPEQAGEHELTVTITEGSGRARAFALPITVNQPPVIQEEEALSFTAGRPAKRQLKSNGGTRPLRWKLVDGLLPEGLELGSDGTITGLARDPAKTTVTLCLEDRWLASTTHELEVEVKPDDTQDQDKSDEEKKDDEKKDEGEKGDQGDEGEKKDKGEKQDKQDEGDDTNAKQPGQAEEDKTQPPKNEAGQAEQQTGEQASDKGDSATYRLLDEAAGERWLDALPEEERGLLLRQLPRADKGKKKANEHPW